MHSLPAFYTPLRSFSTKLRVKIQFILFYTFIFIKKAITSVTKRLLWRNQLDCRGVNTVVVLKIGGLGDFVLGIPALNLLRRKLPNTKIILITAKSLNLLKFSYSGDDPKNLSSLPWVSLVQDSVNDVFSVPDLSFQSIRKLRSLLPQHHTKAVFILGYPGITLPSILKKLVFSRLLSNQSDICFGTNKYLDSEFMREFQATHKLSRHKMLGDIDSVMEAFPLARTDYSELDFNVFISENTADKVRTDLRIGYPSNLILLAPVATTSHKQWPIQNFFELIRRINQENDLLSFALIGTPDHYEILNNYFDEPGFEIRNLCGYLSIDEIAALLSFANGYIGNDGGMSHLAGVLGCPSVIAFNSVEEDWITYPWRSIDGIARNTTDCSPCYNGLFCPQKHRKCVVDLSIESVYLKVEEVILSPIM